MGSCEFIQSAVRVTWHWNYKRECILDFKCYNFNPFNTNFRTTVVEYVSLKMDAPILYLFV